MERIWLAEYLKCFNATEAARRAGYKWPNKVGPQKKQKFAEEVEEAIQEKIMGVDEALASMADQARVDLSPFIDVNGELDIRAMIDAGLGHLIKSTKRVVTKWDDRLEVEVYDKQSALKIVLDHHTKGPTGGKDDPFHVVNVYLPENERDSHD